MKWISWLSFLLLLAGCDPVSTTVSSVSLAMNHNQFTNDVGNQLQSMNANHIFETDPEFKNSNIVLVTFDDTFLLIGQARDEYVKTYAEKIVREKEQSARLLNQIEVEPAISSAQASMDSWITTKIKTNFLFTGGIDSSEVKVVTENGTVYLLGTLTPDAANRAITIAKQTDGVKKVVKVLRYIVEPQQYAAKAA